MAAVAVTAKRPAATIGLSVDVESGPPPPKKQKATVIPPPSPVTAAAASSTAVVDVKSDAVEAWRVACWKHENGLCGYRFTPPTIGQLPQSVRATFAADVQWKFSCHVSRVDGSPDVYYANSDHLVTVHEESGGRKHSFHAVGYNSIGERLVAVLDPGVGCVVQQVDEWAETDSDSEFRPDSPTYDPESPSYTPTTPSATGGSDN